MADRPPLGVQRRWSILQRDDFTCVFCGSRPGNDHLHVDHLFPRSFGGSDHDNNLATSCDRCNMGKSAQVAIPSAWCEPGADSLGHRVWKRWQRWSLRWDASSAFLVLGDSEFDWIDLDRVHEKHLYEHVISKYGRRDDWGDAIDGLRDAWAFGRTLIRRGRT